MTERIYPAGISCYAKHENAPSFIAGDIVIDLAKFREWVNGEGAQYLTEYKGSKQLKLQFLTPRDPGGRPSIQVNNYKRSEGIPFVKSEQLTSEPELSPDDSMPF